MDSDEKKAPLRDIIREYLFKRAAEANDGSAPTEVEITEKLKLSRTPVRKALTELEREGMIIRKKKKGILLRYPGAREIVEIYDARTALEGFAARLGKEKISEPMLQKLQSCIDDYQKAMENNDYIAGIQADRLFHKTILMLADNSIIIDMLDRIDVLERSFLIARNSGFKNLNADDNPASHSIILEKLRNASPDECEQIIRQHIQWGKTKIIERILGTSLSI